jgi:hypothetical protein
MNDDTTPATENQPDAPLQPMPSTPAVPPKTNTLAIIALIAGFVIPLAAFICGGIALSQIKRTGDKGRGLAWSGIIVGAVVTVVAIIVSIAIVVGAAAAVKSASDAISESRSISESGTLGCEDLGELALDVQQGLSEVATATGAERTEKLADLEELSAEVHTLATSIADSTVAAAAEDAGTALDELVVALKATAPDSAMDVASATEAIATLQGKVTDLSAALTEVGTACR